MRRLSKIFRNKGNSWKSGSDYSKAMQSLNKFMRYFLSDKKKLWFKIKRTTVLEELPFCSRNFVTDRAITELKET